MNCRYRIDAKRMILGIRSDSSYLDSIGGITTQDTNRRVQRMYLNLHAFSHFCQHSLVPSPFSLPLLRVRGLAWPFIKPSWDKTLTGLSWIHGDDVLASKLLIVSWKKPERYSYETYVTSFISFSSPVRLFYLSSFYRFLVYSFHSILSLFHFLNFTRTLAYLDNFLIIASVIYGYSLKINDFLNVFNCLLKRKPIITCIERERRKS